jgi:hypothetical protein
MAGSSHRKAGRSTGLFSDCAEPGLALRLVFHQPLRQTAAIRAGALAPMPDGRLQPVLIAGAGDATGWLPDPGGTMNSLTEFELENGTQILVEVPEGTARGVRSASNATGGVAGKAAQTFEKALSALAPVSYAISDNLLKIANRPSEISVEIGFKKATLKWTQAEADADRAASAKFQET